MFGRADHGLHMGQFNLGPCKRTNYETDIRIPIVIVGPTLAVGATVIAMAPPCIFSRCFNRVKTGGCRQNDRTLAGGHSHRASGSPAGTGGRRSLRGA